MDLSERLVAERRARLAAERLLELKSRELFAANRKLSEHARALSEEILLQRRTVEDVTVEAEALRGENERVRSDLHIETQARNVAEHRLWLALETIRDGFAIYDAEDRLVVANFAYLSVFDGLEEVGPGAHARDILRIGLEEGVFDPDGDTAAVWIESMLERWRHEIIEPREIRLWNGRYIRLVDRRGNDGGVVSLALDITDAVRRERQLRQARARAEGASRAKSAFLANMSHELRTPMNGVVGMAELLADTPLSEEQRLYADTIRSSGEALLLIINDVLDYSKLEAEKLTLKTESFDLERLAHEVVTILTPSASEKKLTLAVDYDLFLPGMLVGDPGRIRQILTNLAGNAVKFTEAGHVTIRIVGAGREDGRQVLHVAVEDTGIGIASEMQDHIFGEFNQVEDDRNRKFEGTGLGLAISRRLVKLMSGDIWLHSEPGRGSCFTFSMKLEVAEEPSLALPDLPARLATALLIDAEPVSRGLLARQIKLMGMRAIEAATVAEAAEAMKWESVDAIFADAGAIAAPGFPPQGAAGLPLVLLASSASAAVTATATGRYAAVISRPSTRREVIGAMSTLGRMLVAGAAEAAPPAAPLEPPRRIRILAAEDNRTNQLVFSKMLKDLPVDVTFAGNGREAVEAFLPLKPDVIFMDISMPEMDGKEATRRIRAEEARLGLPHTPVIAMTAHAMEGDQQEILAAGLDKYLTKPMKKVEIYAAVKGACRELMEAHAAAAPLAPAEVRTGTDG